MMTSLAQYIISVSAVLFLSALQQCSGIVCYQCSSTINALGHEFSQAGHCAYVTRNTTTVNITNQYIVYGRGYTYSRHYDSCTVKVTLFQTAAGPQIRVDRNIDTNYYVTNDTNFCHGSQCTCGTDYCNKQSYHILRTPGNLSCLDCVSSKAFDNGCATSDVTSPYVNVMNNCTACSKYVILDKYYIKTIIRGCVKLPGARSECSQHTAAESDPTFRWQIDNQYGLYVQGVQTRTCYCDSGDFCNHADTPLRSKWTLLVASVIVYFRRG